MIAFEECRSFLQIGDRRLLISDFWRHPSLLRNTVWAYSLFHSKQPNKGGRRQRRTYMTIL
jgi:hypothetical protein